MRASQLPPAHDDCPTPPACCSRKLCDVHPPTDALQEYARLDLVLDSEIQRHIDACPTCLAFVTDARAYIPKSEAETRILAALVIDPWVVMDAKRHRTD